LGYDDLIQATTGIMLRFGGGMQTPEEHAHVGTIDVMCGFAAALGVATALYQKSRTGKVSRARTSLAALGNLVQVPFCYDYSGRAPFDEPAGREVLGYSDLSRFYRTADGWLYLDADSADLGRLDAVQGLSGLSVAGDHAAFLSAALAKVAGETWQRRLQEAGVAAAVPDNIDNLRNRYSRPADNYPGTDNGSYSFSVYADHPSGRCVTQLDPFAIRPRHAAIRSLSPAEKFGASTRSVLGELGYSESEVDALMTGSVISDSWSQEYLPS
jgi:crotonobetainyl-CoA:carnitine CoA-transferase CaiB-like acyl-CoA transferase